MRALFFPLVHPDHAKGQEVILQGNTVRPRCFGILAADQVASASRRTSRHLATRNSWSKQDTWGSSTGATWRLIILQPYEHA